MTIAMLSSLKIMMAILDEFEKDKDQNEMVSTLFLKNALQIINRQKINDIKHVKSLRKISCRFEASHHNSRFIVGGHGAGLSNMLFSNDASVMEFAMDPHVDRCYGYMAMSLGLDYWLIPQV